MESKSFFDDIGDEVMIDSHESYAEIITFHPTGCFACQEPKTLRNMADFLNKAADKIEASDKIDAGATPPTLEE